MFWTPLFYGALIFLGAGGRYIKYFFADCLEQEEEYYSRSGFLVSQYPFWWHRWRFLEEDLVRRQIRQVLLLLSLPRSFFAGEFVESVARQSISSRVSPLPPLLPHATAAKNRKSTFVRIVSHLRGRRRRPVSHLCLSRHAFFFFSGSPPPPFS